MTKEIAIYPRHDANATIIDLQTGCVQKYIEFEKISGIRYFTFASDEETFEEQLRQFLLPYINPREVSSVIYNWANDQQIAVLKRLFSHSTKWINVTHHISHVWSAYMFTEPREGDLVVSIDGGGDRDDYFHIYRFFRGSIHELLEVKVNLGKAYRVLGLLSPELYKDRADGYKMDRALSGKKMSLLSYGTVKEEYKKPLENFYYNFNIDYNKESDSIEMNMCKFLTEIGFHDEKFLEKEVARDVLATSQYVFEKIIQRYLYPFINDGVYKRVVMVGGCALNVTMNSKIESDFKIEVFVPPCPNDCGISIGAAKVVHPDLKTLTCPFTEILPVTKEALLQFEMEFVRKEVDIKEIANLLNEGKILATMVGSLEIGPRALGNRSYLASPFVAGMKARLNSPQLKDREDWRPIAPIITKEKLEEYFETTNSSPYMTFAPKVRTQHKSILREVVHIDGTARVQTVSKGSSWIYDLLKAFGLLSGVEILANTSFNKKGRPLMNDYFEALQIFREADIDGVLIHPHDPKENEKITLFVKQ